MLLIMPHLQERAPGKSTFAPASAQMLSVLGWDQPSLPERFPRSPPELLPCLYGVHIPHHATWNALSKSLLLRGRNPAGDTGGGAGEGEGPLGLESELLSFPS